MLPVQPPRIVLGAAMALFALFATFAAAPAAAQEFLRGDSNSDGVVNIADPIFTLEYLFIVGDAPICLDAADANDSGTVNLADPITTFATLFSPFSPLPAPFPAAGIDPTADSLPPCVTVCGVGVFAVDPPVAYTCAGGLVSFSISSLMFSPQAGGMVSVSAPGSGSPGFPTLQGTCVLGVLGATTTLFGGCNETYTFDLVFDTPTSFSGTLTLQYSGSQCGLTNCTSQTLPIAGQQ